MYHFLFLESDDLVLINYYFLHIAYLTRYHAIIDYFVTMNEIMRGYKLWRRYKF